MAASSSSIALSLASVDEEWELGAKEFRAFIHKINANGGTENCGPCTLALDTILGEGIPETIKAVPKRKAILYTQPKYQGNEIIQSFTRDKRLLERFAKCAAPEAYNSRDVATGREILHLDDSDEDETLPTKLYFLASTVKNFAKDLSLCSTSLGRKGYIDAPERFRKPGAAYGILILTYQNDEKEIGHICNWARDAKGHLYILDAQTGRVMPSPPVKGYRKEIFYLHSIPPEGYRLTSDPVIKQEEIKIAEESATSSSASSVSSLSVPILSSFSSSSLSTPSLSSLSSSFTASMQKSVLKPIEDPLTQHLCYGGTHFGLKGLSSEAFEALKREAESSTSINAIAKCNYGCCLRDGLHTKMDLARAFLFFRQATALGDSTGFVYMGGFYQYGYGINKDIILAVQSYTKAAADNQPVALCALAAIYIDGVEGFVPRDIERGLDFFKKAIALKDSDAMLELGSRYEKGKGLIPSIKQAVELYEQAAALNNTEALCRLAKGHIEGAEGFPKDIKKGIEYYHRAADLNDSRAMYELALRYEKGEEVTRDLKLALELYERAMASPTGNVAAMYRLSKFCMAGVEGVLAKDPERGLELLKKAVDLNHPEAMIELALRHSVSNKGVPQDLPLMINLYKRAAKFDNGLAFYYLGCCYKTGHGVAKDVLTAITCFRRSIDLTKCREAYYQLGQILYENNFQLTTPGTESRLKTSVEVDRPTPIVVAPEENNEPATKKLAISKK